MQVAQIVQSARDGRFRLLFVLSQPGCVECANENMSKTVNMQGSSREMAHSQGTVGTQFENHREQSRVQKRRDWDRQEQGRFGSWPLARFCSRRNDKKQHFIHRDSSHLMLRELDFPIRHELHFLIRLQLLVRCHVRCISHVICTYSLVGVAFQKSCLRTVLWHLPCLAQQ